jgi:hypothetical protein
MKEKEMEWACGAHGRNIKVTKVFWLEYCKEEVTWDTKNRDVT